MCSCEIWFFWAVSHFWGAVGIVRLFSTAISEISNHHISWTCSAVECGKIFGLATRPWLPLLFFQTQTHASSCRKWHQGSCLHCSRCIPWKCQKFEPWAIANSLGSCRCGYINLFGQLPIYYAWYWQLLVGWWAAARWRWGRGGDEGAVTTTARWRRGRSGEEGEVARRAKWRWWRRRWCRDGFGVVVCAREDGCGCVCCYARRGTTRNGLRNVQVDSSGDSNLASREFHARRVRPSLIVETWFLQRTYLLTQRSPLARYQLWRICEMHFADSSQLHSHGVARPRPRCLRRARSRASPARLSPPLDRDWQPATVLRSSAVRSAPSPLLSSPSRSTSTNGSHSRRTAHPQAPVQALHLPSPPLRPRPRGAVEHSPSPTSLASIPDAASTSESEESEQQASVRAAHPYPLLR